MKKMMYLVVLTMFFVSCSTSKEDKAKVLIEQDSITVIEQGVNDAIGQDSINILEDDTVDTFLLIIQNSEADIVI